MRLCLTFVLPMLHVDQQAGDPSGKPVKNRAVWERDRDVFRCGRCRCPFNFLLRQHHCRRCGRIYCEDCSRLRCLIPPDELAMPPMGSDHMSLLDPCQPQRVCIPCAEMLIPYQEELRSSVAKAAHEVAVDPVSVQRYMNTPISFKMEDEIKKAVYTLLNFSEASDISGDLSGAVILRRSSARLPASARGIVFMTVSKAAFAYQGGWGSSDAPRWQS